MVMINKMGFYNQFASYYNDVFPLSVEKLNFLSTKFTDTDDGNKILDIGTATGSYAIALAEEGYQVSAVDLNQEMIKLARLRVVNSNLAVNFKVADMLKLDKLYSENYFNGIYCIGNVLVHLDTKKDIKKALGIMAKLLKPKGVVIIQIINYQRILKNNVTQLPVIINEDKGITFSRRYLLEDSKDKIRFITNLSIDKGVRNSYQNTIKLLPLLPDELLDILGEIGFQDVKLYASFSGEGFNEQAVPCIAVGRL
ncbi:class I SAM-dependent methyltransferase [Halocella sp. SP3-1]|uniref:class I SAM-dependent methyltransferase n=1 Tax=Halocella sp. SP3-1 TaxID=2382161 RepID=UPI000F750960|nr:class I SAM-dependent methyltransferase [Halocella sp. SP3-1]AZO95010.1 class I SAM-dependent methyltransferase [Halocella sp. SP3-1]MTI61284.1 class I SAM-dependent methyltransferase [Bacillota bacterium]